jgi:hypothetical protein
MKVSFTRGNFNYVFERVVDHKQSRETIELTKTDRIRLISVSDKKYDTEIDPAVHKASISKQAWESLIKDVKYYTCSICAEYCPKGECVNKRYHFPNGKPK